MANETSRSEWFSGSRLNIVFRHPRYDGRSQDCPSCCCFLCFAVVVVVAAAAIVSSVAFADPLFQSS